VPLVEQLIFVRFRKEFVFFLKMINKMLELKEPQIFLWWFFGKTCYQKFLSKIKVFLPKFFG
jgi:hypothetical protein